jgi:uncharacterized protein (DUF58 family)
MSENDRSKPLDNNVNMNTAISSDNEKKVSTQPAGFLLNKFVLIAMGALLAAAAWAGQTVIVILLGLALASAGLSRLWSHFSLKGVRCERQLNGQRAFPGETLEMKLRLVNRKPLPLPWIEITDEVPAGFTPDLSEGSRPGFNQISLSTSIMWYSAINWKYSLHCQRRGYYPLGPLTVTSGDIFGFYPRTATATATDHIIVYPRVFSLSRLAIPSLYPLGEAKSEKRIFEDPSRTIGVREYSPGDSLRRIHWKASARHRQLQVKVFEPTTTLKAAIFLAIDSFQNQGLWDYDAMELGISTAASLAQFMIDKNSQVGLLSNSKLADSDLPASIPSGSGVDQLLQILEALAKSTPIYSESFLNYFQKERKGLPMGTTLIFVFACIPDGLKAALTDLRESGYKVIVFQVGEVKDGEAVPEISWYSIREYGEPMLINQQEN